MEHAVFGCPVRAAFPQSSRMVMVAASLAAAVFAIFLSGPASATNPFTGHYASGSGPNRAGTLVLHANPSIVYTNDTESYCDSAGVAICPDVLPDTERDELIVVHLLAAFSPDSSPRLSGVVFGLQYPPSISLVDVKKCADFFLPSETWPSSGSGVAVSWDVPQTDLIVDVYWFSAEISAGESGLLDVTPHPTQGAYFADDAIPAHLDPITALGNFGFHQAGNAPCAGDQPESGACCLPTGDCINTDFDGCAYYGGEFLGDGVPCVPNPCDQPPTGACCLQSGACIVRTLAQCETNHGTYLGDGVPCIPNPCPQPPTGACCLGTGSCVVLSQQECTNGGGFYQGDDVPCDPNPCPAPGSCCLGSTCRMLIEIACQQSGGVWLGGGSCDPNPCVIGACCYDTGACTVQMAAECTLNGGVALGEGTDCDPNPCPNPCNRAAARGTIHSSSPPVPRPADNPFAEGRPSDARSGYGPHWGGTLILHSNPSIVYTDDAGGFCGSSALVACADAIDATQELGNHVIHVLAAFHQDAQPALTGVTFGVEYGLCVDLFDYGPCADFELPMPNWPASGEGTAVTWAAAQTTRLTEVYWFAAYHASAFIDALRLTPHPTQGGYFADDSDPAFLDEIADYGVFGFGQPGRAPCPEGSPIVGACCVNGICVRVPEGQCAIDDGFFLGASVPCDPNPCDFTGCNAPISSRQITSPHFRRLDGGGRRDGGRPAERAAGNCGELFLNGDGSYEDALAWSDTGVAPPYFGAFAECYEGVSGFLVCSIVLDLTQNGGQAGQTLDAYVWEDDGGCPGNVYCLSVGVDPGPVAFWPEVSRHVVPLDGCCVYANFWVGYWGNWPGAEAGWFVGADLNPGNGCAATFVAPGQSMPVGWQLLTDYGALGIGCEVDYACGGTPTETTTWGRVKMLFR